MNNYICSQWKLKNKTYVFPYKYTCSWELSCVAVFLFSCVPSWGGPGRRFPRGSYPRLKYIYRLSTITRSLMKLLHVSLHSGRTSALTEETGGIESRSRETWLGYKTFAEKPERSREHSCTYLIEIVIDRCSELATTTPCLFWSMLASVIGKLVVIVIVQMLYWQGTAIYQAKQKLASINQAKNRKISSEELIKYAHKISASNAVAAPSTWGPG